MGYESDAIALLADIRAKPCEASGFEVLPLRGQRRLGEFKIPPPASRLTALIVKSARAPTQQF
jgi:hypothetical protein